MLLTIMIRLLLLSLLLLPLQAKHLQYEKVYQKIFCEKIHGQTEVVLSDRTRVDCLSKNYAIEVDFAPKWHESIGQSLYYAISTNKKAGVLLILEDEKRDIRYLKRLKKVALQNNIRIWTINHKMQIRQIYH